VPTQANFAALFAEDAHLSRPIEDEMLRVEYPDPASTSGETILKDVRWGDTWDKFQRHYARKREELTELQGEMDEVVREMRGLEDEVVGDDGEMKRAVEKFEGEMEGFRNEVEAAERACAEEREAMEKEEREEGRRFRRKFDEFLSGLGE
jgi:predicted  nucleic acid-binding Zn-ribbon protein